MQVFNAAAGIEIKAATFNNLTHGSQTNHINGDTVYNTNSHNTNSETNYASRNLEYSMVGGKRVTKTGKQMVAHQSAAYYTGHGQPWEQQSNMKPGRSKPRNWYEDDYSDYARPGVQSGGGGWGGSSSSSPPAPPHSAPPRTNTIAGRPYYEQQSAEGFLPHQGGNNGSGRGGWYGEEDEGQGEYQYDPYAAQPPPPQQQQQSWANAQPNRGNNWENNRARYQNQTGWNSDPNYPMHTPQPHRGSPDFLNLHPNSAQTPPQRQRPPYSNNQSQFSQQPQYGRTPSGSGGSQAEMMARRDPSPSSFGGGGGYQNDDGYRLNPQRRSPNSYAQSHWYDNHPTESSQNDSWLRPQSADQNLPPQQQQGQSNSKNPFLNRNLGSSSAPPSTTADGGTPPVDSMQIDP